jgi:hypothetical protein
VLPHWHTKRLHHWQQEYLDTTIKSSQSRYTEKLFSQNMPRLQHQINKSDTQLTIWHYFNIQLQILIRLLHQHQIRQENSKTLQQFFKHLVQIYTLITMSQKYTLWRMELNFELGNNQLLIKTIMIIIKIKEDIKSFFNRKHTSPIKT